MNSLLRFGERKQSGSHTRRILRHAAKLPDCGPLAKLPIGGTSYDRRLGFRDPHPSILRANCPAIGLDTAPYMKESTNATSPDLHPDERLPSTVVHPCDAKHAFDLRLLSTTQKAVQHNQESDKHQADVGQSGSSNRSPFLNTIPVPFIQKLPD